jgi:hypothetical protein
VKIRLLLLVLICSLFIWFAGSKVNAQDQPDDTAARCRISQNFIISTIRPRDLRARVNRLQAYRYIYGRLDTFVQRLENNDQQYAAELRTDLDNLNTQIDSFKDDYEVYDQARQDVINQKDCPNNFTVFQEKLEIARVNRQQVGADVSAIQSTMEAMKSKIELLRQELLATGQSEAASE